MQFLFPFINLISSALSIYAFLLICYIIIYYLLMFKIINGYSPIVMKINNFLIKIIEPVLVKIRKIIPPISGIDISMIALFLAIYFAQDFLYAIKISLIS